MAAVNDITGDPIISKKNSKEFSNRYNWAFCKNEEHKPTFFDEDIEYTCPECGMVSVIENGMIKKVR